jgi:hypothetical protein
MVVKLYSQPGSHPCAVAEAALKLKNVDYQRIDLLPLTQRAIGPLRYGGGTVPGMRIDGERIVGSRAILRRLDELVPDPALYPAELERRKPVLEAEAWGDETFQSVPRRIVDVLFLRNPRAMESYAGDAKLPLPMWPASTTPATRQCKPTWPRCPVSSTGSTTGSPEGCSVASSRTPPTSRSAPRSACSRASATSRR